MDLSLKAMVNGDFCLQTVDFCELSAYHFTMQTYNYKELRKSHFNSPLNVHNHLQHYSVDELQEISLHDRLPWHTLCLNVLGDLNTGTIIRTNHCLGASSVIVFGRKKIDNRSMVGSGNYIHVEKITGIFDDLTFDSQKFFETISNKQLAPVFVETGGLNINEINWQTHVNQCLQNDLQPCLVMGNETNGIPEDILDYYKNCPHSLKVSIPQRGVIRSLNVGIAHSIVAWHMMNEVKSWISN